MTNTSPLVRWLMWGFLGLAIASVSGLYLYRLSKGSHPPLPIYGSVSDFTLTNQAGETFRLDSLRGRPWVGNIIFTRCPGPCAKMTRQMQQIQRGLPAGSSMVLVSFTADPRFDTPEVLRKYAERFEAEGGNWQFLTGTPDILYRVATNDLKFTVVETDPATRQPGEDPFIHSTKFVLVDRAGRVRAYFDGEDPRTVELVLSAAARLERENTP